MKRTLKLINKWKLSLCDKSRHKKRFHQYNPHARLAPLQNYIFPPVSSDENRRHGRVGTANAQDQGIVGGGGKGGAGD